NRPAMSRTLAQVSRAAAEIPSLPRNNPDQITRVNDRIEHCHESSGDPSDPPALAVTGPGKQMVGWHDEFCEQRAGRGFHVVRVDNRVAGRSTHMDFRPPTLRQLAARRFRPE